MPKVQPIQTSFSSGEITPLLRGHTNVERYATGLETCENFIPRPQGPVDFRRGREVIAQSQDDGKTEDARCFPLNVNFSQTFCIVVTADLVEVFDHEGAVLQGAAGIDLLFNGGFEIGLLGWSTEVSTENAIVTWVPETSVALLETDSVSDNAYLAQAYAPSVTGNHTITIDIQKEPFTAGTLTMKVGTAFNDGSILTQVLDAGIGQTFTVSFADTAQKWVTFDCTGVDALWGVRHVRIVQEVVSPTIVSFASPWAGFVRWRISAEQHPIDSSIILCHPNVPPQELKVDAANNWTLAAVGFTGAPTSWTGTNWPAAITFGESSGSAGGRSWWGGEPNKNTTFYGSKSNDYFNLTGGPNPDDGVQFTIAKRGAIRWMSAGRRLIIGTETGEYVVNAEGGVITSSDVSVDQQSAYGSFAGQNVEIGEKIVYVSAGEQKLRVMGYQWQQDAWISVDLAWPSEHITRGRIADLAYAKDPIQTIWMHDRLDNKLLVCAYDREQNIVGWAQCPTPGEVLGLTVTEFAGASELWTLSRYIINGAPVLWVERQVDSVYMDMQTLQTYPTKTDVIQNLGYLEGRTVGVKVDGANHPDRTVASGQITLQSGAHTVEVGLRYSGRVKTLPLEGGNPRGTAQGTRKRWNRIWLRIDRSAPPKINGELVADRDPQTLMDTADADWTEDIKVTNLGVDTKAQVELVQDLPFKTTVLALFGEASGDQP